MVAAGIACGDFYIFPFPSALDIIHNLAYNFCNHPSIGVKK